MENIVMRYFRETYGHTPNRNSSTVKYPTARQQLLSESQAIKPETVFLLEAAEQHDLMLARDAIIDIQKGKN